MLTTTTLPVMKLSATTTALATVISASPKQIATVTRSELNLVAPLICVNVLTSRGDSQGFGSLPPLWKSFEFVHDCKRLTHVLLLYGACIHALSIFLDSMNHAPA